MEFLPFDEIEGSDTEVLGNFVEFVERLFFARWRIQQTALAFRVAARFARNARCFFSKRRKAAQRELNRLRAGYRRAR